MSHRLIQGFSLIEILVSLLLFSLMLLGFDTMAFFALKSEKESWYLTIATEQLANIAERLRSLGDHEGLKTQVNLWNQENLAVLPGGSGEVSGKYPAYTISIHWNAASITDLQDSVIL